MTDPNKTMTAGAQTDALSAVAAGSLVFKATADKIIEKLHGGIGEREAAEESPMARLVEEMKALVRDLPARVADRMSEVGEPFRKRRLRRFHPMMFEDILHMTGDPTDPVGILMGASLIRDEAP